MALRSFRGAWRKAEGVSDGEDRRRIHAPGCSRGAQPRGVADRQAAAGRVGPRDREVRVEGERPQPGGTRLERRPRDPHRAGRPGRSVPELHRGLGLSRFLREPDVSTGSERPEAHAGKLPVRLPRRGRAPRCRRRHRAGGCRDQPLLRRAVRGSRGLRRRGRGLPEERDPRAAAAQTDRGPGWTEGVAGRPEGPGTAEGLDLWRGRPTLDADVEQDLGGRLPPGLRDRPGGVRRTPPGEDGREGPGTSRRGRLGLPRREGDGRPSRIRSAQTPHARDGAVPDEGLLRPARAEEAVRTRLHRRSGPARLDRALPGNRSDTGPAEQQAPARIGWHDLGGGDRGRRRRCPDDAGPEASQRRRAGRLQRPSLLGPSGGLYWFVNSGALAPYFAEGRHDSLRGSWSERQTYMYFREGGGTSSVVVRVPGVVTWARFSYRNNQMYLCAGRGVTDVPTEQQWRERSAK